MAQTKEKPNKSEIVRKYIQKHPEEGPKAIEEGLKKAGHKNMKAIINFVKYKDSKHKTRSPKKKKAAKKKSDRSKAGAKAAATRRRNAKKRQREEDAELSTPVDLDDLLKAKKIIEQFDGDHNKACEAISIMAKLIK